MEEYTAIHEKLQNLFAEANEWNRDIILKWLMSIEYAKENEGHVENIKILRNAKRFIREYEDCMDEENIFS